jgi:hypothetical protein
VLVEFLDFECEACRAYYPADGNWYNATVGGQAVFLALHEPESLLGEVGDFAVDVLDPEDELARGSRPDIDDCAASACGDHFGSWREDAFAHTRNYAGTG